MTENRKVLPNTRCDLREALERINVHRGGEECARTWRGLTNEAAQAPVGSSLAPGLGPERFYAEDSEVSASRRSRLCCSLG